MMNREEMDEMVIDYLYDELSDAKRASFEEALPSFPDLSKEVSESVSLRQTLRSISPEPVPTSLTQRILEIAEQEGPKPQTREGGFFNWLTSALMQPAFATAMVFLVVGSTTMLLNQDEAPLTETTFDAAPEPQQTLSQSEPAAEVADEKKPSGALNHTMLARKESGTMPTAPKSAAVGKRDSSPPSRLADTGGFQGKVRKRGGRKKSPKRPMAKNLQTKRGPNIRLAETKKRLFQGKDQRALLDPHMVLDRGEARKQVAQREAVDREGGKDALMRRKTGSGKVWLIPRFPKN